MNTAIKEKVEIHFSRHHLKKYAKTEGNITKKCPSKF